MRILSSWHLQLISLLLGLSALLLGFHRVGAGSAAADLVVDQHYHDKNSNHHNNNGSNSSSSPQKPFCHGMYMTMFMDGFRFSLHYTSTTTDSNDEDDDDNKSTSHHHHHHSTQQQPPPCLAYYVKSWKLNMSGKFRGACVFSFLLAILTEGLAASRFVLVDYIQRKQQQQQQQQSRRFYLRKIILTLIYAVQSWMGTMIMLVSMMYSIELLFSVVAGLMVGNFLFVRDHPTTTTSSDQRQHQH